MGRACSMHERKSDAYKILVPKLEKKRQFGRRRLKP
jgi:hypothetical protein